MKLYLKMLFIEIYLQNNKVIYRIIYIIMDIKDYIHMQVDLRMDKYFII